VATLGVGFKEGQRGCRRPNGTSTEAAILEDSLADGNGEQVVSFGHRTIPEDHSNGEVDGTSRSRKFTEDVVGLVRDDRVEVDVVGDDDEDKQNVGFEVALYRQKFVWRFRRRRRTTTASTTTSAATTTR